MATVERRLQQLEKTFAPPRRDNCDPSELTSEELAFEMLEMLPANWTELLESPDWAIVRDHAGELNTRRHRGLRDYIADDDPRLSDPVELYVCDRLRDLLGRFHDKVKDPTLLLERYRGLFPDRVLVGAYYAAWHHRGDRYSPQVRARMKQLAGIVETSYANEPASQGLDTERSSDIVQRGPE